MDKELEKKDMDTTPSQDTIEVCGLRKGGIYSSIKMSKKTADAMVIVCGLLFVGFIVLMVVL